MLKSYTRPKGTSGPDYIEPLKDPFSLLSFIESFGSNGNDSVTVTIAFQSLAASLIHSDTLSLLQKDKRAAQFWKSVSNYCKGIVVRYASKQDGISNSDLGTLAPSSRNPLLLSVNKAAWCVVKHFLMYNEKGCAYFIQQRLLSSFLNAVAIHSSHGVASNALLTLKEVIDEKCYKNINNNKKAKEKDIKSMVSFMLDHKFQVQVHLLYIKTNVGNKNTRATSSNGGMLYALSQWASAVLHSDYAAKFAQELKREETEEEYYQELLQLDAMLQLEQWDRSQLSVATTVDIG